MVFHFFSAASASESAAEQENVNVIRRRKKGLAVDRTRESATGSTPWSPLWRSGDHLRPPSCSIGAVDTRKMSIGADIHTSSMPRSLTYLRAVQSGSQVLLTADPHDNNDYLVTVRAKFAGETEEGRRVCGPIKWNSRKGALLASDERLELGSVWEFELLAPSRSPARTFTIWRQPGANRFAGDSAESAASMFSLACDNWKGDRGLPRRNGFAGRVLLEVEIPIVDGQLSIAERSAVSEAILDAAALWVAACRDCGPDHLAVIQVPEGLYIRAAFARWLEEQERGPFIVPTVQAEHELLSRLENLEFLTTDGTRPAIKQLEPYVPTQPLQNRIDKLCAARPDKGTTPTIVSIHLALCRNQDMDSRSRAQISLVFRSNGQPIAGQIPRLSLAAQIPS